MSTSPILALRSGIIEVAEVDLDLVTLMGGTLRLYDEPPRAAEPVYAVFGDAKVQDGSTGSERGHEQEAVLAVWAEEGSSRAALHAAERFAALLHDAHLNLPGHRLVNLRVTAVEAAKDDASRRTKVTLRLRAVTEMK